MMEVLVSVLSFLPPEIASALLAALPVTELRAALPIALVVFKLDPLSAFFWTVLGNLVPLVLIFTLLPPFMRWALRAAPRVNAWLDRYFARLAEKHGSAYAKWGAFFLFLFVAVPLPGTGVWTGSVLAVIFRIPRTLAIPLIIAGLFVAGLLVLAITRGVISL